MSAGSSGPGEVHPTGVALAVLAGACYGVYTTAAKALLERGVAAVPAMAAALGLGAVLLTPVLSVRASTLTGVWTVVMVAWLGLATTALAYVLFARGVRRLHAGTVGTLSLGEPLTAAALGLVVLGERPGPVAAVGAATLLAGLALARRGAALRPLKIPAMAASAPTAIEQDARAPPRAVAASRSRRGGRRFPL